ncbi:MAG: hypothetical protein LBO65_09065 [Spirochaetaceae bacterium]|jgi:hypothetical protein|nr:hypothetical protein [Spirochaetaceae bacterium]
MNQDQVKAALLGIEEAPLDFELIFSGKKSKKVNGLYKSETREIIIHNRNFSDENLLLYTAIHEYAHHLHACARGGTLSSRTHTAEFWAILHRLLEKAEAKNIYKNVFDRSPELTQLTELIQKKYLYENGSLVKELGKQLLRASELCSAIGGRFEDYLDRVLRIPRVAAHMSMKMYQYDLDPAVGSDNMRFLAGIKNDERRTAAESALKAGKSPDTVKVGVRPQPPAEEPRDRLEKEKARLERTIASLSKRLKEVEAELTEL